MIIIWGKFFFRILKTKTTKKNCKTIQLQKLLCVDGVNVKSFILLFLHKRYRLGVTIIFMNYVYFKSPSFYIDNPFFFTTFFQNCHPCFL